MATPQSEKPRGLPNPYAQRGLPNPYADATVAEAAPVKFSEEQAKAEQKKANVFHNPHSINRPQAKQAKGAGKKNTRHMVAPSSTEPTTETTPPQQPSIEYWRSNADDDAAVVADIEERKREDKQRQKEQKKLNKQYGPWRPQAAYKADRFSNLGAFRASGAYRDKQDSFRAFLRNAPSRQPQGPHHSSSDASNASRRASSSSSEFLQTVTSSKFAPPAFYDQPSVPSPPASIPNDEVGADTYAHPAQLSQQPRSQMHYPPPPPSNPQEYAPPPPPPPEVSTAEPTPPPPPPPGSYNPVLSAAPVHYNATISAPPVRYDNATVSAPPVRNDEERPAKRQKLSKAEVMMAKMGYIKGQGLGKNNDGITTHLEVKARKVPQGVRQENFDEDNGANVKAQQVFDIRGGHRARREEPGMFGDESRVVVTWGCLDGLDWDADSNRNDGGVRQDMGDAFGYKFGTVERVHVNMASPGKAETVYIKFNSPLSALNAVNRFHEGYEFRDRKIRALYYNEAKFEAGIFDH